MSSKIRAQSAIKRPLSKSRATPVKKKEGSDWDIDTSRYNKTYQKLKSELSPLNNPKVVSSFKTLTMLLKECIVNEKTSSKKYESTGECGLNSMFIKTALITFRDWRDKIYSKLTLVVDVVADSDDLLQEKLEQQARGAIEQLKNYSHKIQEQLERFIALKEQSYKLIKLNEKYSLLLDTIDHVLRLIDCMRALNREIGLYLQAKKGTESSMKELQEGVRKISESYEEKAKDSLNYCSCHPDNKMLLRLEYKVRRMLKCSTDKVMAIFESIRQLQKYESHFQTKMNFLSSFEDLSHQFLQHILETLYNKNEELRSMEKKFLVSKQPEFISLREKIEDWETNFIKKLRIKTMKYFKDSIIQLNGIRTLHLFKSKGKQYTEIKKKILLLAKIYQQSERESNLRSQNFQKDRNSIAEIISLLDETVAAASPHILIISTQIEKMDGLGKRNGTVKEVQKCCEQLQTIEKSQTFLWKLFNAAYVKMSRLQGQNAQLIQQCSYFDKQKMSQLHQLLTYSRNEQLNNDIFRHFETKKSLKQLPTDDFSAILNNYQQKFNTHQKFARAQLQSGIEHSQQLKQLLKDQLIAYVFQDEFKGEFISAYPMVKEVSTMQEKVMSLAPKDYISNTRCYRIDVGTVEQLRKGVNEQIKKLEKSKYRSIFNKYIIFIYQNALINLLNMKTIYFLYTRHENNLQPFRAIFHTFTDIYERVLAKRGDEGEFGSLTTKIYEISQQLNAQNKLVFEYASSSATNQYFPANLYLQEWLLYEFSCEIEDTISKSAIFLKRAQTKLIFNSFINRLQAQREKFRASKMTESKDIYQHISRNVLQLRKFTFQQSYKELLIKIIEYLRKLNISHSAIFTRDQAPVFVLINITEEQIVNRVILNRLNIGQKHSKSVLSPFQPKFRPDSPIKSTKQIRPATPIKMIEVEDDMAQEIQGTVDIQDDVLQEQIVQLHSDLPLSSSIKPNNNTNLPNKSNIQSVLNQQNSIMQSPSFQYYILQQIQDANRLKSCLYYNKNQYSNIQTKLKIDVLCKSLNPQGRVQAIKHLQDILQEVRKHDLIRLMKLSDSRPQCEQRIIKFQDAQRRGDRIAEQLRNLFEYFRVQSNVHYSEGGNSIVSFRKYNEKNCYIHAQLRQNIFRKDLKQFSINEIQRSIWEFIASPRQEGFNQTIASLNQLITRSNFLLSSYYQEIQRKLSVLNGIEAINKKEISEAIYTFLKQQLNNRYLLSIINNQIKSQRDLVEWIGEHEKELKKITVINAYFTFKMDDLVLVASSEPINESSIAQCLLIPITKELMSSISFDKGNASIKSFLIRQHLINQTSRNKIAFSELKQSIDEVETKYLTKQSYRRQQIQQFLKSYQAYAHIYDSQMVKIIQNLSQEIAQELSLFQFLLNNDLKSMQTIQQISFNKDIQCKLNKFLKYNLRYFNSSFLQTLTILLKKCKIDHHILQFSNKTINVFESFNISLIADWFSFSPAQSAKLQANTTSAINIHTIKRLFVTFVNLILPFQTQQMEIAQQIKSFLSSSTIQIKSGKQAFTANCLQLLEGNSFEVQVSWPKNPIEISYSSRNSSINLQLQQNQYHYYSQIEIVSLQSHLKKEYDRVKSEYFIQKQRADEEARRERIRKEEYLKELKMIEQSKELEQLKHQQQMAKIIYETEQIKRAMREKQAQQKVKLKFIEEITLKKLHEQYNKDTKQQQKQLKDKLNNLSQNMNPSNSRLINQQIEFQLVLSDGQGQLFDPLLHTPSHDIEYDYKMTLYQYIRQCYHNLRKPREVDLQQWLHHF